MANAKALAAGLAGAGFRVVSGGTDTHLMLVDVFAKGVRGKEAEIGARQAPTSPPTRTRIPFDTNPPLNPSGMRFGSPAVTTRGFGEAEMSEVAALIAQVLSNPSSEDNLAAVRRRVEMLTRAFPLYPWKFDAVGA